MKYLEEKLWYKKGENLYFKRIIFYKKMLRLHEVVMLKLCNFAKAVIKIKILLSSNLGILLDMVEKVAYLESLN